MINVGILGTGDMSERFAKSATLVKGLRVEGVLSRDLAKAREFSQRYKLEMFFDNYEDVLQSKQIDAVYIALPNSLHFSYALQAVEAGKMVILEKPFVSNMTEFDALISAAKHKDVMLFELDRVLSSPNFGVIRDHLSEILPVRIVTINYSQYSRRYDDLLAGKVQNVFSEKFSGGALVDLGVYGIHFVTDLFGAPEGVNYTAECLGNKVDISGNLVLKYPGMIASLIQSKNTKCNNSIVIQGEKGTIYASGVPSKISKVELDISTIQDITASSNFDNMAANLEQIVRIVEENDQAAYEKNLKHIRIVMETLVRARKSAGIVFSADR